MSYVYMLLFANGKKYIGITKMTPEKRFRGHVHKSEKSRSILYNAWKKHGAPTMTVIAIVEKSDLLETEIRAIRVFDTLHPNGYNTTKGGDVNPMSSPEVQKKHPMLQRGIQKTPEHKKSLSEAAKQRPVDWSKIAKMQKVNVGNQHSLGYKHTDEARAAIAEASRNQSWTPERKAKISASLIGRKVSDEARRKMSESAKNRKKRT